MFAKSRARLLDRLKILMDRYLAIGERAGDWKEFGSLAVRRGLDAKGSTALFAEMTVKAEQQVGLCGECLTLLVRDRALPFLMARGVSKAEKIADEWELILDLADAEAGTAREAVRKRVEAEPPMTKQRATELADLALRLAEADAEMSLRMKMQQYSNRKNPE